MLPCYFVSMSQWNLLLDDNRFQLKVFYLVDIFSRLNELSYSLQGKTNLRQRLQKRSHPSKRSYHYGKRE